MRRALGLAVIPLVVAVFALRIHLRSQPREAASETLGDSHVYLASLEQQDPYRAYFTGHWCNCWRKQDIRPSEASKQFEGVLPRAVSPPWGKLKTLDIRGMQPDERLLAQVFAGLVNRRVPMWYLIQDDDFWFEGQKAPWKDGITGRPIDARWANNSPMAQQVGYTLNADGRGTGGTFMMGLKRFINEIDPPVIDGVILYDPALLDPDATPKQPRAVLNVIRMLCATEKALPMTPQLMDKLAGTGWSAGGIRDRTPLPVILDTTTKEEWMTETYRGDEEEAARRVYQWAFNSLWDNCLQHCLAYMPPLPQAGQGLDFTDYIVQFKLFTFYVPGDTKLDERVMESFLADSPFNVPVIGTMTHRTGDEAADDRVRLGRLFSRFGKYFVDFTAAANLSFHSGERKPERETLQQKHPAPPAYEAGKKYISFCVTTGTSVGGVMYTRPWHWDFASRGDVPLGWAIPLAAADAIPNLMKYYYNTATDNDCFLADTSGIGALVPTVYGAAAQNRSELLSQFLQYTDQYMGYLDLALAWADELDNSTQNAYLTGAPRLQGLFYGREGAARYLDRPAYALDGKPVFHTVVDLGGKDALAALPQQLARAKGDFIFVGLDESAFDPDDDLVGLIADAAGQLGDQYVVVRPDHLAQLFAQNAGTAAGPPGLLPQFAAAPAAEVRNVTGKAPAIDGKLGEWSALGQPLPLRGGAGNGTAYVAYDDRFLYLAAEVPDSTVYVDDYDLSFGDRVDLCVDARTDRFREPRATEGYYRLTLVPANGLVQEPELLLVYPTFDVGLASMNRHGIEEILASRVGRRGYVMEAAIPLRNFPRARWQSGARLALGIAARDVDDPSRPPVRLAWGGAQSDNPLALAPVVLR